MKKLALSLAVLFAVGMVSCGGNKEKEECADSAAAPVEVVEEGVAVEEQVAPADSAAATDSAATTPEAAPEPTEEAAK